MNARVAIRYAKPLFQLAEAKNILDDCKNDMELIAQTCKISFEFRRLLKNPIINPFKKKQIIENVFKGKLNSLTLSFLSLIAKKNRFHELEDISKSFVEIYKNRKGILTVEVITALALSNSLRNKIISIIEKAFPSKKVVLSEKIDVSVIGGFILKIDDRMIDASIKSKLQKLNAVFADGGNG
ncbi:MAG: ATP synthase F1 subunit delta [Cytophagales bacterium]|nr:ATP synthase F1 subunit delta [Cytophagales bacterium]MDW8383991.1 ATP synthase F1 subunit delta [Flammeovirgaceae bacterium]